MLKFLPKFDWQSKKEIKDSYLTNVYSFLVQPAIYQIKSFRKHIVHLCVTGPCCNVTTAACWVIKAWAGTHLEDELNRVHWVRALRHGRRKPMSLFIINMTEK